MGSVTIRPYRRLVSVNTKESYMKGGNTNAGNVTIWQLQRIVVLNTKKTHMKALSNLACNFIGSSCSTQKLVHEGMMYPCRQYDNKAT